MPLLLTWFNWDWGMDWFTFMFCVACNYEVWDMTAWMSNYISEFYPDVIIYSCHRVNDGLANRAGVKYVFVFANTNTNTNTNTAYLYLYLYLIKFQTMYLYLYLYLIHCIWCIWQIRFQIHFFLGRFPNTNLWKKTYMNILYRHVKECYSFSK